MAGAEVSILNVSAFSAPAASLSLLCFLRNTARSQESDSIPLTSAAHQTFKCPPSIPPLRCPSWGSNLSWVLQPPAWFLPRPQSPCVLSPCHTGSCYASVRV